MRDTTRFRRRRFYQPAFQKRLQSDELVSAHTRMLRIVPWGFIATVSPVGAPLDLCKELFKRFRRDCYLSLMNVYGKKLPLLSYCVVYAPYPSDPKHFHIHLLILVDQKRFRSLVLPYIQRAWTKIIGTAPGLIDVQPYDKKRGENWIRYIFDQASDYEFIGEDLDDYLKDTAKNRRRQPDWRPKKYQAPASVDTPSPSTPEMNPAQRLVARVRREEQNGGTDSQ